LPVTSNQHTGSDAAAVDFLARLGAAIRPRGRHDGTVVRSERDLRFDQTFPLTHLVERAETSRVTPGDGLGELDHIADVARGDLLRADGGALGLLGRLSNAIAQLLPTVARSSWE
jgi:hypothetical protein